MHHGVPEIEMNDDPNLSAMAYSDKRISRQIKITIETICKQTSITRRQFQMNNTAVKYKPNSDIRPSLVNYYYFHF